MQFILPYNTNEFEQLREELSKFKGQKIVNLTAGDEFFSFETNKGLYLCLSEWSFTSNTYGAGGVWIDYDWKVRQVEERKAIERIEAEIVEDENFKLTIWFSETEFLEAKASISGDAIEGSKISKVSLIVEEE